MRNNMKKRLICALMLAALLLSTAISYAGPANADELNSDDVNRFNVILVIDGSGSLVSGGSATDKGGLRYDAINLFLALLTNEGNQVGAIVFDNDSSNYLLKTDLSPVSGKQDKEALAGQIRNAGTRNDTDIGSALLSAVEILETSGSHDGRKPAVVLFSDGRTDLGGNEEAYKQSLENQEMAITKAQTAGIPIYSICLNASPVADPKELSEIASRTSGGFVSVGRAEDLAGAFEAFYQLIFNSSGSAKSDVAFDQNGKLSYSFDVPTVGAEEVNIILKQEGMQSILVNGPFRQLDDAELEDSTMSGGDYDVIKLVNPEVGQWHLELTGTPGSSVTVNVIYNADSVAELVTADGKSDYGTGENVTFQAYLKKKGNRVTDASVLNEYRAVLHLSNLTDGTTQDVEMTPDASGMFTYVLQTNQESSYSASATLEFGSLIHKSGDVTVNFGNTPPAAAGGVTLIEEKVVVTPISGRHRSYNLDDYFSDTPGDMLRYEIVSSQLVSDTAEIDGSTLNVETYKSKSGDLTVKAMDSHGAQTQITFRFKVTNLTLAIFIALAAAVLVGAIVVFGIIWGVTHPLWKGELKVTNLDRSCVGMPRSHASFRGKLKLAYFMVGPCGLQADQCWFVTKSGGRLKFRSKKPFYVNGTPHNEIDVYAGMTIIYADETNCAGIRIDATPRSR